MVFGPQKNYFAYEIYNVALFFLSTSEYHDKTVVYEQLN